MTKQELEQKIDELQKQLDELKNVKVDETNMNKKWMPEENEEYYYINPLIMNTIFEDTEVDNNLIKFGNYFKTKEEAQFVADKIKYTLMFKHYVEEHSEPLDWENEGQEKWCICYNNITHKIDFYFCTFVKEQGVIYASSTQILQNAIEYVGEDNFKKYILEVED